MRARSTRWCRSCTPSFATGAAVSCARAPRSDAPTDCPGQRCRICGLLTGECAGRTGPTSSPVGPRDAQVIVDMARTRASLKRAGVVQRVSFDEGVKAANEWSVNLVALDDALGVSG